MLGKITRRVYEEKSNIAKQFAMIYEQIHRLCNQIISKEESSSGMMVVIIMMSLLKRHVANNSDGIDWGT